MPGEIKIDLKDKVVVITGGTKGLGREIALGAAREGAKIAVCSRSEDALEDLRNDLVEIYADQSNFYLQAVDVTEIKKLEDFASNIVDSLGKVDVLIANAGVTDQKHHSLVDLPNKTWEKIIKVNLNGSYFTIKTFLPLLEKSKGNLIIMTSLLGQKGYGKANDGPYCTTKFGLEGLKEVAAEEYQGKVNVNTIFPAEKVNTNFFSHLSEEERAKLADPEVIVEPTLFLASLPEDSLTAHSLNAKKWREDSGYKEGLLKRARKENK